MPAVKPSVMPMPWAFASSFMRIWMTRLPTETKLFCSITGSARSSSVFSTEGTNTFALPSEGIFLKRSSTNTMVSMHEAPCAMNVAHATPATPHGRTITRSSTMLLTEDITRNIKGVRLSPRAEKMPVPRLYSMRKGSPK